MASSRCRSWSEGTRDWSNAKKSGGRGFAPRLMAGGVPEAPGFDPRPCIALRAGQLTGRLPRSRSWRCCCPCRRRVGKKTNRPPSSSRGRRCAFQSGARSVRSWVFARRLTGCATSRIARTPRASGLEWHTFRGWCMGDSEELAVHDVRKVSMMGDSFMRHLCVAFVTLFRTTGRPGLSSRVPAPRTVHRESLPLPDRLQEHGVRRGGARAAHLPLLDERNASG